MDPQTTGNKGNGWALFPFAIFFILYVITFAVTRDLRNMPVSVAFTIATGIVSDMGELIIVSIMAGGVFEVIKYNKGIDWLIYILTRKISTKRGAEFSIAGLVIFTNFCTANNTITCIITGPIAKDISTRFGLDSRKTASLMDTFSCFVQGMIPYGAQLLIAAGIANINPMEIVPRLYYPFLIGIAATIAIALRYPKRYS